MKFTLAFDVYNKQSTIGSVLDGWLSNLSRENEYEFIVVFDDLRDNSKKIVDQRFKVYKHTYLPLFADNKYEIYCNNLALQNAKKGNYIIFIQDDNYMYDKNWDLLLAEIIKRTPNLGVIGFLSGLRVLAPPIRWECIETDRPHKGKYFKMREIESYDLAVWQVDAINRPFCINKQLLNALEGLDKEYEPTFGDDFDLSLKLLREGRTNLYIPFDLKNTGGFKETLDKEFFKQTKREARKLWETRYGYWLERRCEDSVRKLWKLQQLPYGLGFRRHSHGTTKLSLGVRESMASIGWQSLDVSGFPDIKDDAEKLNKIGDSSCETILASAILEHLNYQGHGIQRIKKTIAVLKIWKRKLRLGGKLYICVPDGDIIIDALVEHRNQYWDLHNTPYKEVLGFIYGKGSKPFTHHRMIYNFSALKYCLEQAGFKEIKRLDDSSASDEKFLLYFNLDASDHGRILRVEARKP